MRIAIIGGIGSGKSEVLKIAHECGFSCVSADEINARLLRMPSYIAQIENAFPSAVVNGVVDKKKLASIIFNDDSERQKLNAIAHPLIMQAIYDSESDLYAVEMPLILESGAIDYFDEIVLVSTPLITRLHRLRKRGLTYRQAIARIRSQASEKQLKAVATCIVDNSNDVKMLHDVCTKEFEKILNKADNK